MTASPEILLSERDLRSATRDIKRYRDSASKWRHGVRLPSTTKTELRSEGAPTTTKLRPQRNFSDAFREKKKAKNNPGNSRAWTVMKVDFETVRFQTSADLDELTLRQPDDLDERNGHENPQPQESKRSTYDAIANVASLDKFVRPPTVRDTQRLVEREYEVLDQTGRAMRGQMARKALRTRTSDGFEVGYTDEDLGFEMV